MNLKEDVWCHLLRGDGRAAHRLCSDSRFKNNTVTTYTLCEMPYFDWELVWTQSFSWHLWFVHRFTCKQVNYMSKRDKHYRFPSVFVRSTNKTSNNFVTVNSEHERRSLISNSWNYICLSTSPYWVHIACTIYCRTYVSIHNIMSSNTETLLHSHSVFIFAFLFIPHASNSKASSEDCRFEKNKIKSSNEMITYFRTVHVSFGFFPFVVHRATEKREKEK